MAKRAKKDLEFVIRCAHCFKDEFKLEDVKPDDTIKIYTDTPCKYAVETKKSKVQVDESQATMNGVSAFKLIEES